jgi:hypothetical protein
MRTSFHHQPEAQHPNFSLSTSRQADYPILSPNSGAKADMAARRFVNAEQISPSSPLWVRREDVIFCRHGVMALIPALGVTPMRRKSVGRGIIAKLGVCPIRGCPGIAWYPFQ